MVDPAQLAGGDHTTFVSGDDAAPRRPSSSCWRAWGTPTSSTSATSTTARGTEMLLPIWLRLMGALGTPMFNFKIVR